MNWKQRIMSLGIVLSLATGLLAQPAMAQDNPEPYDDPTHAGAGVHCHAGVCSVAIDMGDIELDLPVPSDAPFSFDVPAEKVAFLAGAGVEIGDRLTLKLPFGNIQVADGDFVVRLDENGEIDRLRGTAQTIVPTFNLLGNIQVVGPFAADFGYDYGANLAEMGLPLDPDRQYAFFDVGSGFSMQTLAPGEGADGQLSLTVPEGRRARVLFDLAQPLVYVEGDLTIRHALGAGIADEMLTQMGVDLPIPLGVRLPLRSELGGRLLVLDDMSKGFVELEAQTALQSGPVAQALRLPETPLAVRGLFRADGGGLTFDGVAMSPLLLADQPENAALVRFHIPYGGGAPSLVLNPSEEILAADDVNVVAAAGGTDAGSGLDIMPAVIEPEPAWWSKAGRWIGERATGAAGKIGEGLGMADSATAPARQALAEGAASALENSGESVQAAATSALEATSCAMGYTQQLWCGVTGLCEPAATVCGDTEATATK